MVYLNLNTYSTRLNLHCNANVLSVQVQLPSWKRVSNYANCHYLLIKI